MENNRLNKARIQRLEDFSRDFNKFATAGAQGKFPRSKFQKIQRHKVALQTMRDDKDFQLAANAFLRVIDLAIEMLPAIKAGDVDKVAALGDEIAVLFKTAEGSIKNGL